MTKVVWNAESDRDKAMRETEAKRKEIQPFTYYKNDYEKRAFLVIGVDAPGNFGVPGVDLMQWGDAASIRVAFDTFLKLIADGKLKRFIPQYNQHVS